MNPNLKKQKLDLFDAVRIEKNVLDFFGINPKPPNFSTVRHTIVGCTVYLLTLVLVFSMFIQIYIDFGNFTKIIDTLYFCTTELAFLLKLVNYSLNRKVFISIEKLIKNTKVALETPSQQELIQLQIKNCKFIGNIYRLNCAAAVLFFSFSPFIDTKKLLPLSGHFFVDPETYRVYIFTYQVITITLSAICNATMDTVAFGLIFIGGIQFDILSDNLLRLNTERQFPNQKEIEEKLKKYAKQHKMIIKYVILVESLLSNGIFIQFFASVVVICFTGFQIMIVPPKSAEFVMLLIYFLCMMAQVTLYCWFGHELSAKSNKIGDACYMSKWYEFNIKIRKTIFIIMERSKRPVCFSAAKLFILSLPTLARILRHSYSYFAVLQRLYKGNARE